MKNLRLILLIFLIALVVALPNLAYLYTEYLWYLDLGYDKVFLYKTFASVVLFLISLILSLSVIYIAILPVIRETSINVAIPLTRIEKFLYIVRANLKKYYKPVSIVLAVFVATVFSIQISSRWEQLLLFFNSVPYGKKVPVYGLDVSFFLFKLPIYQFFLTWLKSLLLGSLLIVLAVYFLKSLTYTWNTFVQVFYWYRKHVFLLLGTYFVLEGVSIYLKIFSLAYSKQGVVFGPGFVDVKYLIPFFKIASVACVLLGLAIYATAFRLLRVKFTGYLVLFSLIAYFLGTTAVPAFLHAYIVSPNELKMERPYIKNNIVMTREAYDLDMFKEKSIEFPKELKTDEISMKNPALSNARLWDTQPLFEVFNQVQSIRSYYVFTDIDIDRYLIDGKKTQVAISVRELDTTNLSERARTWINLHLKYTHGYGAVVSSVNRATEEGLPVFYLKDLPPKSTDDVFELKRPQVYFGEKTENYIIVNTAEEEFGYPSGDKNVYERWQGEGGIKLDSYLKKLAFALRFGALKIMLTREIKDDSVLLFDRNINVRLKKIAPFFVFDSDPYPVIANGQIYWICDGYSVSDKFPYSEPYSRDFNYLRNSVKAVVDAYSGRVTLYVFDEKDPIIRAYAKIFPGMFRPLKDMPEGLRSHVRYPVDLFSVQAAMLSNYHMVDVQVFYNKEDRWAISEEVYEDTRIPVEPYYVMMPSDLNEDGKEPEFVLILPMTPFGKNNLVSWIFVSSDGENYGKGGIYKFSKGTLVYGPLQVEARINQDPEISKELTLWSQAGSKVIRGNLLVIPLRSGVVYIEPLYLKSEQGSIPELKRVIAADLERVVMAESLEKALYELVGGPAPAEKAEESDKKTPASFKVEVLNLIREMDEKLKKGDLKGFAEVYQKLKETLGLNNGESTGTKQF
ncbi:MAG: UPF0182 family protein [Actinobacteria bacterium]|nr:UPF0182 family protein [Actinomycetota bacterium]